MFGGSGYAHTIAISQGTLNDLWSYSPVDDTWTWRTGTYEKNKGCDYPSNISQPGYPGSRIEPATWVDLNGDLWMFGGMGYRLDGLYHGLFSDLWRFDVAENEWTWEGGPTITDFEGNNVYPRSRHSAATFTDTDGNFYLFGGLKTGNELLNDLWKFDPSSRTWVLVAGDADAVNTPTDYPAQISMPGYPGARRFPATWVAPDGDFYLYGGHGYHAGSPVHLSDFWKYSVSDNEWIWLGGGTDEMSLPAEAGQVGWPGRRYGTGSVSVDGSLYLFGGHGRGPASGFFADIWKFNPNQSEWTWVGGGRGVNSVGHYINIGLKGVPHPRAFLSSWGSESEEKIYIFGGNNTVGSDDRPFADFWSWDVIVDSGIDDWQLWD